MYENKFKPNFGKVDNGSVSPAFCPCQNNGCTHACANAGIGCFRSCMGNGMFGNH